MSYALYEQLKADWIRNHPEATPQQYQTAMQKLAKKLGI